jgi:hypothetical protein
MLYQVLNTHVHPGSLMVGVVVGCIIAAIYIGTFRK